MKNTGKPYEGELHVRFDEKAEENMKSNPPLYSTTLIILSKDMFQEILSMNLFFKIIKL